MKTRWCRLLACSALLAAGVQAEEAADSSSEPSRPEFKPFTEPLEGFVEQFIGDKWAQKWKPCVYYVSNQSKVLSLMLPDPSSQSHQGREGW